MIFKNDLSTGDKGHVSIHNQISDRLNQACTVLDYGAVGDGETDDTAAIQAAIDAGSTAHLESGKTYIVSAAGSKNFIATSGSATSMAYCLDIPPNTTLNMNGATLKLKAGEDAVLLSNRNSHLTTDTGITVINGTLDGNDVALTSKPLVFFYGVSGLDMQCVKIKNATHIACQVNDCSYSYFDKLIASDIVGNAFAFGVPGQPVTDSYFGYLSASNIDEEDGDNFPGNPFVAVLQRCKVDAIHSKAVAAGIKIYGDSSDVLIDTLFVIDETLTGANSGVKVQGDDTYTPIRISINGIVSNGNQGAGLYLDKCSDVNIGSYIGCDNGKLGTYPDAWIAGTRTIIRSLQSTNAGQAGVIIRSDAVDFQLGSVSIANPGAVSDTESVRVGISMAGGNGYIQSGYISDDRETALMRRGLDVNGAESVLRVGSMVITGQTENAVNIIEGASVAYAIAM